MPAPRPGTITKQFRDFSGGLNNTDARTAIRDNQLFANENVQPIGQGNQQILPPRGPTVATIAAGIATLWGVNIKIGGAEVGRLITVNNDGSISAINPLTGAVASVAPAATVTTSARLTMFQDGPMLIGDPTNGYFSWDGTTLNKYPLARTATVTSGSPVISGIAPNTTGLAVGMALSSGGLFPAGTTIKSVDSASQITATANATGNGTGFTIGSGAPTAVIDLAVFETRAAFVTATRTILVGAPASFTDFATADGSTTISLTDSTFAGNITRLLSALELLWVLGPNAINTLSNFQTSGATTTFANTNIVSQVGTVLPSSVTAFLRTFLLLAPYGIYAVVGATPQKLSDTLDGLLPMLVLGTDQPAAVFSLNNVFVWGVLVTFKDPVLGNRPIILCFARNAFFTATQGANLKWITSLVDPASGRPDLWGTDGTNVFKCFAGTAAGPYTWRTKLWDFGAFTQKKQVTRVFTEFASPLGNVASVTVTLESESGNQATPLTISAANTLQFTGFGGANLNFVGTGPITWVVAGIQQGKTGLINFGGNYVGLQIAGTSLPFLITGIAFELEPWGEAT